MMMNEKDLTDDYIEGLLRDHFKAEVAEQPASRNPWDWLKSRLESPSRPPGLQRVPERDIQAFGCWRSRTGSNGRRGYVVNGRPNPTIWRICSRFCGRNVRPYFI